MCRKRRRIFKMSKSINEPRHDKTKKMTVRPAKTQISLGIRPVWSESSLSAWRKHWSLATHWAHTEDSDQTGRMPRLIWVFAGRTVILLVLSWGGSFVATTTTPTTTSAIPTVKSTTSQVRICPAFDGSNCRVECLAMDVKGCLICNCGTCKLPQRYELEYFVCLCWSFTAQSTTRSCRANQLIVALLLGRLRPSKRLTRTSSAVTDNYRWGLTAETTIFQSCSAVSQKTGHYKGRIDEN